MSQRLQKQTIFQPVAQVQALRKEKH